MSYVQWWKMVLMLISQFLPWFIKSWVMSHSTVGLIYVTCSSSHIYHTVHPFVVPIKDLEILHCCHIILHSHQDFFYMCTYTICTYLRFLRSGTYRLLPARSLWTWHIWLAWRVSCLPVLKNIYSSDFGPVFPTIEHGTSVASTSTMKWNTYFSKDSRV